MARTTVRFLVEHQEEILRDWIERVRVLDGAIATAFTREPIDEFCRSCYRALIASTCEDSHAEIRAFVHAITPRLVRCGMRLGEVHRLLAAFKESATLHLLRTSRDDLDAFVSACQSIDQCIDAAFGTLGEAYPVVVNADVDAYVRALEARNRLLQQSAIRDGMTGLYTHQHFYERLADELRRASRYERTISLLLLDVDKFKRVNDTRGHLAGDRALQSIANQVRSSIRDVDLAARYGGDEFAVLLPETGADGAAVVAERIRSAAERTDVGAPGIQDYVTLSVGIAVYPDHARSSLDLVEQADQALYAAKRTGKNRIVVARDVAERSRPSNPASQPVDPGQWIRLAG